MCNKFDFFPCCNKKCCGYVGIPGARGPKGDPGSPGSPGEPGTPGSDGKAATITIGTVTSGDTPSVTNVGTENAAILDFVLVPGKTGPQGPPGPAGTGTGLAAYGGGYNSSAQTLSFVTPDVYIPISINTSYPLFNVTKSGNNFVVSQSGNYEIIYNLLVNADKSTTVTTVCTKNGVAIPGTENSQLMNTNSKNDGIFSGNFVVTLNANDIIGLSVKVSAIPQQLSSSISSNQNCSITIKKIG